MEEQYTLPAVYVPKESAYPDDFLSVSETVNAISKKHIKVVNNVFTRRPFGSGGKLPLCVAEDTKTTSRPVLIEFAGTSTYGVSKYKAFGDDKKQDGESWSIAYSIQENPSISKLAEAIDALTVDVAKEYLPKIYAEVCGITDPKLYPTTVYRKTARGSTKYVRLTIQPGKVEFGPKKDLDKVQSLEEFPHDIPGPYHNVMALSHIDVSYKEDVLSIGPILYAKMIRADMAEPKKRKLRDENELNVK